MEQEVRARGIKYIWHFTRLGNLDGILRHGLIGRDRLAARDVHADFNDEYRFDGHEDAVCCSVGHPNYKMFYRIRVEHPEVQWVVVALHASVLWEKDCAFCATNAASNSVTCLTKLQRTGPAAFARMFDEVPGKPPRAELKLPDSCPTDPQAEVLVFDDIEVRYIAGVATETKQLKVTLEAQYPGVQFIYNTGFFSARKDYEHWK